MSKKVSIIIPCYNKANYVSEAIDSALNQTYSNLEIVIVDDCSNDGSQKIIESYAKKYKNILFFQNTKNEGVIYSRNIATEAASGDYILPLDADDTIENTYVECAAKVLDEHPEIGIVYCKAKFFGAKNQEWKLPEVDKTEILFNNCIFCSAMFRKSDFIKTGGYKENMRSGCEDWDLWLSFLAEGFEAYRIDEILFNYRITDENSRSDVCRQNSNDVFQNILENHKNLYLKNRACVNKIFDYPSDSKIDKKKRKYKKLFNVLLYVCVIEFIIILILGGYLCFL